LRSWLLPENALIIMNIADQVKTKKRRMFFLCSEPLPRASTGDILKP